MKMETKYRSLNFRSMTPQMKRKWLHSIRRDEGKYFKVTEATKVCSRHYRPGEIKKTLAGKNELSESCAFRVRMD